MLPNLKKYLRNKLSNKFKTTLEDWFYYWLCAQNADDRKSTTPNNCYYEFGVGWGRTLSAFTNAAIRAHKEGIIPLAEIKIHGFDSFIGLPEKSSPSDDHPDWHEGAFAYDEDYVRANIDKTGFPQDNIIFHKGFFDETLSQDLAAMLMNEPPSIVTIDVDYYSSTREILEFMGPLLKSGTVFYFDDLYSFHLHPEMGQLKAIQEFQGKHGYLSPLREYDYAGRTFIYSSIDWEYGSNES